MNSSQKNLFVPNKFRISEGKINLTLPSPLLVTLDGGLHRGVDSMDRHQSELQLIITFSVLL
jgi:hypothetical protein